MGIEKPIKKIVKHGNINVEEYSRISLPPHLSLTTGLLGNVFPNPTAVTISQRSTLLVVGKGSVVIKSMLLDGALVIVVPNEKDTVLVENINIINKGWNFISLKNEEESKDQDGSNQTVPEALQIRGYDVERLEECTITTVEWLVAEMDKSERSNGTNGGNGASGAIVGKPWDAVLVGNGENQNFAGRMKVISSGASISSFATADVVASASVVAQQFPFVQTSTTEASTNK